MRTANFQLVHNGAVSLLRHHDAQQRYLSQQTDIEEDFTRSFIQQETLEALYDAIDTLPERYQRLLQLSFERGLRNTDIAERLCISTRAVTKQKARLLELLRKQLPSHAAPLLLFLHHWS